MSGGRTIGMERFDAPAGGRRPAVLILHGADGMTNGERYRVGARVLASAGYHVFLPHYLDRTGERRASYATLATNFAAWTDTVLDALNVVAGAPGVDPRRLGLLGTSLGGALGLAVAADDRRVRAFANYFGFLPESVAAGARRLPPTLVLHGARDSIVPVSNAYAIEELLKRLGVPHEVHVYPDQAHGFAGAAQFDAAQRTATFFGRYLAGRAADRHEEAETAAG
jgi:carboxymethylenebutenolidase